MPHLQITPRFSTTPKNPSIEEPHDKYTDMRFARPRGNFHHNPPWYRKGTWASSDEVEKDDTSFMRMTWFEYERHMRVPPEIKEKKAWMKSAKVDAKPNSNSEVTDVMDKVRGRKRERHGADTQKAITTPAVALVDYVEQTQIRNKRRTRAALKQRTSLMSRIVGGRATPPLRMSRCRLCS
jgi:hypothetical protein